MMRGVMTSPAALKETPTINIIANPGTKDMEKKIKGV